MIPYLAILLDIRVYVVNLVAQFSSVHCGLCSLFYFVSRL